MKVKWLIPVLSFVSSTSLFAQDLTISEKNAPGFFPVISSRGATAIYVDSNDHWLMHRSAELLQQDLQMVTGQKPEIVSSLPLSAEYLIILGSADSSRLIQRLAAEKKIDLSSVKGKWENGLIQTLTAPVKGIQNALIITGSDRRGTAYGVFELSRRMGVSPWYWWADVPVKKKNEVFLKNGIYYTETPSVKYRGIFINDEAPAFSGWTKEKFGGVNHLAYEKIFELMLRMKANYLWPAMWGNAFNDDDPLNPVLADRYGIVMGTTHHEPMLRAQQEWKRYGKGLWNYDSNEVRLKAFWKKGIEQMDSRESIVTIGMRGDGDMPMTEGSNIALLERIVKDQRNIIAEVTHKPPAATPQLWALYKEVQNYYDKGMTVPDDITLLLCDDNWGNIRKLPKRADSSRAGGFGIYYHFDYVGDPRNYKWLNTNSIPRVWEQMHLAYEYGADRIWIVNVGDIKPMELPIQFFLDYAWNTKKWNAGNVDRYTHEWAEQIFGPGFAADIADILKAYTKYNSRRKPELLAPDTYSLVDYQEAETVVAEYNALTAKADKIYNELPASYRDAYYQLVLYPVAACANLNKLYLAAGQNRLYAAQGRASTNDLADSVKKFFDEDAALAGYYNEVMSGGKWNHMMDQTHIGYTYWQQPAKNAIPKTEEIQLADTADMGLAIEGSASWWPKESGQAILPGFDSFLPQSHYFELFNRGKIPFAYKIEIPVSWITVSGQTNKIEKQERLWVQVDWDKTPSGLHTIPINITGPGSKRLVVYAIIDKPESQELNRFKGFAETNGYVSMEADHYTAIINKPPVNWQLIRGIGRTGSGMTIDPVTAQKQTPGTDGARLEYKMFLSDTGMIRVQAYFSPTLNFNKDGLEYGISIDDNPPQIINIHAGYTNHDWEKWVADNIIISSSTHEIKKPGIHILKYWMVDPGLVLQKIVAGPHDINPSYLGPPETLIK